MRLAEKPFTKAIIVTAGQINTIQLKDSAGSSIHCNHIEVIPTDPSVAGYFFITPSSNASQLYAANALQASAAAVDGSGAAGYCGNAQNPVIFDLPKPLAANSLRISNYSASNINFIINYGNRTTTNPNAETIGGLIQGR